MDFSAICRTCLGTGSLSPIFEKTVDHEQRSSDILVATGTIINLNDGLPQQMCVHCVNYLNSSLRFRQQCKDAETKLLQLKVECTDTDHQIEEETGNILNIELKCELDTTIDQNNLVTVQSDEDSDLENDTPLSSLSDMNRNDDRNTCQTYTHLVEKKSKELEENGKSPIKKEVQSDDSDMDFAPSDLDPLSPDPDADTDGMDSQTPIEVAASSALNTLLPEHSRDKYLKVYTNFMSWRSNKKLTSFSENVILVYFNELSKKLKPSTLWGMYSMLKQTLIIKHNVNIKDYKKLLMLLKKLSDGFKPRKSKVLTLENVVKFLDEAPDEVYLAHKVVLIFGVNGACKSSELVNLKTDAVENHTNMILVNIPKTKSQKHRSFVIRDDLVDMVKRYQNLRPKDLTHDRFFINYYNGKCTKQPIGIHKLCSIPKTIAAYLKLPNSKSYTGQCFFRTSANLLTHVGPIVKKPNPSDGQSS